MTCALCKFERFAKGSCFYIELVLSFSFTCELYTCLPDRQVLHPNFAIFEHRSYGYATKKRLHYGTKAITLGSKQKLKTSSLF